MGGHGGLNILHQKKWNVYNLDNRMKVEKDKREAAEKERNKEIERRNKETEERLNMIRGDDEPERKDRRAQKEPEVKQNNLIAQELRNIQESKKHINLFENEQKMIENREVLEAKILKEREFLKDKSFDMSSKFLGAYSDQQRQPWYLKPSQKSQQPRAVNPNHIRNTPTQNLHHLKNTHSQVTKDVLVTEFKQHTRDHSRSRSRDKEPKKEETKAEKMERLRQERRVREEKERKRAQELIKSRQH